MDKDASVHYYLARVLVNFRSLLAFYDWKLDSIDSVHDDVLNIHSGEGLDWLRWRPNNNGNCDVHSPFMRS